MATLISTFRDPLRAYLLDTHPTIKQYDADQLDQAVRLVVNLGKAPGITVTTGDDANDSLTPDVTPVNDESDNWARIVLHAAKRFVLPNAAASSYRTRAVAETFGESREMVFDLLNDVYQLEFGAGGE
jgi:hypothetical protein